MSLVDKILFSQVRVGLGGRLFTMYKFQTMDVGLEDHRAALVQENGCDPFGHVNGDPRVTRLGRYMRQYALDEIPQIWNIAKGDMALVGPRPKPADEFELLSEDLRTKRAKVRPGMIGCTYADYFEIQRGEMSMYESEMQYLSERANNHIRADIKYFLKIVYNFMRGARSS